MFNNKVYFIRYSSVILFSVSSVFAFLLILYKLSFLETVSFSAIYRLDKLAKSCVRVSQNHPNVFHAGWLDTFCIL